MNHSNSPARQRQRSAMPSSPAHRRALAPISTPPLRRAGHTGPRQQPTNAQRQALRRWWADDSLGKRKHEGAATWWKSKYGYEIKRSTLSDALSAKFAFLDEAELSAYAAEASKSRDCKWPELEACLIEWQIRYDRHPDTGNTTGDLLRLKATEFWHKLSQYAGMECPKWTNGWLGRFKKRNNLKERRRHGEGASAQIDEESEAQMEEIRKVKEKYSDDCTYNMDETGYYWKLKPDRSLSTFEAKGEKKQKARITAALTCNASGTDKLLPWFIGTACRPNCFRAERIEGLEHLGGVWRHNKTAWMTHHIMKDYLKWFDNRMKQAGKKVLLLMDNFSAHELAVELMEEGNELRNTKVY